MVEEREGVNFLKLSNYSIISIYLFCADFQTNIVRYNEETWNKVHRSSYVHPESVRSQTSTSISLESDGLSSSSNDLEMPMPPLALAPLQQEGVR